MWSRLAIRSFSSCSGRLPVCRCGVIRPKRPEILGFLEGLLAFPGRSRVVNAEEPVAHRRVDGVAARLVVVVGKSKIWALTRSREPINE